MRLTKLNYSTRTPVARTALTLKTFLDTYTKPVTPGLFWIQTILSPPKCMMMRTSVGTGIGQPQAMNPRPKNHDQGTYYST